MAVNKPPAAQSVSSAPIDAGESGDVTIINMNPQKKKKKNKKEKKIETRHCFLRCTTGTNLQTSLEKKGTNAP